MERREKKLLVGSKDKHFYLKLCEKKSRSLHMFFSWLLIIFSLASSWLSHYHLAVSPARPTCYAEVRHRKRRTAEQSVYVQQSWLGTNQVEAMHGRVMHCVSTATSATLLKCISRSVLVLFRSGSEERLLQLKLEGNSAGRSVITWVGILAENPNLFLSLNRNKCRAVTMERLRMLLGSHTILKYNTHRKVSHGAGLAIYNQQSVLMATATQSAHLLPVFFPFLAFPNIKAHTTARAPRESPALWGA